MPVQMHYILTRRESALLLLTFNFHYIPTGFKIPEAEVLRGKVKIKNIKVLPFTDGKWKLPAWFK